MWWYNPYSNSSVDYENFCYTNFLILVNLEEQGLYEGELTATLKFEGILEKKFLLVYMPVFAKQLTFDDNFNPTVEFIRAKSSRKRKLEE